MTSAAGRVAALLVAGAAAAALAACSSPAPTQAGSPARPGGLETDTSAPAPPQRLSGTVNVFAAASLQGSFTTLAERFRSAHPDVTVTPNFGASSALAQQIVQGAPADVFASASPTTMDQVVQAGAAATPTPFARNSMEIAVPTANPAGVTGLSDLAKPGVKVAVCQAQVPCGSVAGAVFSKAGISVTPVTQESDVKAVLTKVQLGEVDAGVVYVTDVLAAGPKVRGVPIAPEVNASTSYPIAVLRKAPNAPAAQAFVDFVLSEQGRSVLTSAGFTAP